MRELRDQVASELRRYRQDKVWIIPPSSRPADVSLPPIARVTPTVQGYTNSPGLQGLVITCP